jgi:hypothetical protein
MICASGKLRPDRAADQVSRKAALRESRAGSRTARRKDRKTGRAARLRPDARNSGDLALEVACKAFY